MRNNNNRVAVVPALLLIVSVTLLGGCSDVDPAALELFVADMLRNATVALLL